MKGSEIKYTSLGLVAFIVFIGPFFYLTKYIHPAYDDFCRGHATFGNFIINVQDWLLTHNGRYFNALLSFLPVYELPAYRLSTAFLILIFCLSFYYFFHQLLLFWGYKIKKSYGLFLSVIWLILIVDQIPSIYEFFFWYAGATVYLFSGTLLLIFSGFLMRYGYNSWKKMVVLFFLVVAINGNNEMAMAIINIFLLFLLLFCYLRKGKFSVQLLLLNLTSWISSLVVVFLPGSINRRNKFEEVGDVFYSIKASVLSSGMFSIKSIFELPYVFVFLGFLFYLYKLRLKEGHSVRKINPFLLGGVSFIVLVGALFVVAYAKGFLILNWGRIGNFVHFIFSVLVLINLINIVSFMPRYRGRGFIYFGYGCFTIFLLSVILGKTNFRITVNEIVSGSAERFDEQMQARLQVLKNSDKRSIIVDKVERSKLMGIFYLSDDPRDWRNRCYVKMINHRYGKNIQDLGAH